MSYYDNDAQRTLQSNNKKYGMDPKMWNKEAWGAYDNLSLTAAFPQDYVEKARRTFEQNAKKRVKEQEAASKRMHKMLTEEGKRNADAALYAAKKTIDKEAELEKMFEQNKQKNLEHQHRMAEQAAKHASDKEIEALKHGYALQEKQADKEIKEQDRQAREEERRRKAASDKAARKNQHKYDTRLSNTQRDNAITVETLRHKNKLQEQQNSYDLKEKYRIENEARRAAEKENEISAAKNRELVKAQLASQEEVNRRVANDPYLQARMGLRPAGISEDADINARLRQSFDRGEYSLEDAAGFSAFASEEFGKIQQRNDKRDRRKRAWEGLKGAVSGKLIKAIYAAPLAMFGAALAAAARVTKKFSDSMDKAAAVGQNIETLNGLMGGSVQELTKVQSNVNSLNAQFGRLGNSIKVLLGKLAGFLTSDALDKMVADTAAAAAQATAKAAFISSGQNQTYAEQMSEHVMNLADRYLMKKYDVSLEDARGSDSYAETVKGITDAIINGGEFEVFNTDLWKAFMLQEGKYTPGLEYTKTTEAQAREALLERQMAIYTGSGGADAVAHFQHQLLKTNKLLEMIGGSLYSFDEVENIAAYTDKEYKELVSLNENSGQQMTKISKGVLDLGNEFGLTVPEMRRIEEYIQYTGNSIQDVRDLLAAGVYFENDDILNLLKEMHDKGLTTKGSIELLGLTDINLNSTEDIKSLTTALANMPKKIVLELNTGTFTEDLMNILEAAGLTVTKQKDLSEVWTSIQNVLDTKGIGPDLTKAVLAAVKDNPQYVEDIIKGLEKFADDWMDAGYDAEKLLSFVRYAINPARYTTGRSNSVKKTGEYFDYYNNRVRTPFTSDEQVYSWFTEWYDPNHKSILDKLVDAMWQAQYPMLPNSDDMHAAGGIGTQRMDGQTLFENGPEAIIPLTSNLGVDYMTRVMEQVNANNGSSDSLTVNFNGPVFTEDQRQLQYWAEKLGETYDTIKKRRGVV